MNVRRDGFTLLELLLAVALLAILLGSATPAFLRGLEHARLATTARALVTTAKFARFHSIMFGRPVFLVIDIPARRFWLQAEPMEGMEIEWESEDTFLPEDPGSYGGETEEWDLPGAFGEGAWEDGTGSFEGGLAAVHPYEAPEGIVFDTLVFAQSERLDATRASIVFFPDGTCSEFTLVMEDARGRRMEVWFDPLTSQPEVREVDETGEVLR